MRVLVTGGGGVLGRATVPLLHAIGHEVRAPRRAELDIFDPDAVERAVEGVDAILHLATRIPARERAGEADAWRENDRLREEASRLLVDAGLEAQTKVYIQPSVTFLYPEGAVADEETRIGPVHEHLRSAVQAEEQAARFAAAGRRGVVLRLGLLDGAGTGSDEPDLRYGATLNAADAGAALAVALTIPSGVYNVCRNGERVSNVRFKETSGWHPAR